MANPIKVGTPAPDFTLKDQNQQEFALSSLKGKKKIVLCFYPLDWSPVCTTENTCFTNDLPKFTSADAEVLGVSRDSTWSHKAWAEKLGLKHRLLADMKLEVAGKFGLARPDGFSERATVVIGKDGVVKFVKVQEVKTARNDEEILAALKSA